MARKKKLYSPRRRKICKFCKAQIKYVDYKDDKRLRRFITDRGKIIPRRVSGTCAPHQRQLKRAIKKARFMALLPYIADQYH